MKLTAAQRDVLVILADNPGSVIRESYTCGLDPWIDKPQVGQIAIVDAIVVARLEDYGCLEHSKYLGEFDSWQISEAGRKAVGR